MLETKYPIEVLVPPAITVCNGIKYAVAGVWIPIPNDVTHDDLEKYVIWKRPEVEKPLNRYFVASKSGNKKYTVLVWKSKITCDCSGYRWRAKCKHADAVKKLQKK